MSPESPLQAVPASHPPSQRQPAGPCSVVLHRTIFFFLALFVILVPHSIKGARYAWLIAFWVWIVGLLVERRRILKQPLTVPLLAYIVLSTVSTIVSPNPLMSLGYLKLVCYTAMIGTLVAQSLTRLSQIRTLIVLLLLSAAAAAAFTAWQYTYGIGVRVTYIPWTTPLHHAGIFPNDVIVEFNGRSVHSPRQLFDAMHQAAPSSLVRVNFLRGLPYHRRTTIFRVMPGGLDTAGLQLARGRPNRAQGTLGHYGIFAEVLMPIGCLAWALTLGYLPGRRRQSVLCGLVFLALTITIFATQTRAALAGLLAGCMVSLLLLFKKRARLWTVAALLILAVGATLWIQHARRLGWVATRDAGTQYRWLMWEDGMRLALHHPFFGVGMGTIYAHWEQWHLRAFTLYHVYYNFHSDFVQISAERGFLTLAAWLWFVVAYLIFLFRLLARARRENRFAAAVVAGILGGLVAFLFPSLVESALNDDSLVMLLFFCFGIAVAIDRLLQQPGALDVT